MNLAVNARDAMPPAILTIETTVELDGTRKPIWNATLVPTSCSY